MRSVILYFSACLSLVRDFLKCSGGEETSRTHPSARSWGDNDRSIPFPLCVCTQIIMETEGGRWESKTLAMHSVWFCGTPPASGSCGLLPFQTQRFITVKRVTGSLGVVSRGEKTCVLMEIYAKCNGAFIFCGKFFRAAYATIYNWEHLLWCMLNIMCRISLF